MSSGQIPGAGWEEPERLEASVTVALVRTYCPQFAPKVEFGQQGWWSIELPRPASADYQFTLHGGWGGERQISARRTGAAEQRPRNRFWYSPMELAGFRDDVKKLEELFQERVKALMLYPTRITESRGVILLGYKGEYQTEAGWQRLGGVSYLGLGFGVPLVGKKHIYSSPPVVSCTQI
jgi:hypothetical protein